MRLETLQLSNSPVLADLRPGERSLWRFMGALGAGIGVFIVANVLALAVVLALFVAAFGWPAPTSVATTQALFQRLMALTASDGSHFSDALQIIALALSTNVAPMFAFIGVAALIHGVSIRDLATTAQRFRWRTMLTGIALSAILIGPILVVTQMMDPKAPPPPLLSVSGDDLQRIIYGLVCIVGFIPAAMGEEILFRGWLLRQSGNLTRNVAALMALNGVVFAAAHLDFAPDAFLERAIMGAGFVYMTLRLGGTELSCGAHAANNLMIVLFLQPLTLKLTPNTGLHPADLIQYVGLFAIYIAMAELTARWSLLRRWSGLDAIAPSAAPAGAGPWG